MKNIQMIGWLLVAVGSFLPLVHIPIIGNWNYWKIDHNLAVICWIFLFFALIGILMNKAKWTKFFSVLLILLFIFTIAAIHFKSLNEFSFLPFKKLREAASGIVKLRWGWLFEFSGAILMLPVKKNQI